MMETTRIDEPTPSGEFVRLACLAAAIAASALLFSMSTTNFLDVKDTALAILLAPFAILSALRSDRLGRGVQSFLPLILLACVPFLYGLVTDFPQVPELMHREQVRLGVLILYAVFAFDLLHTERRRNLVTDTFLLTASAASVLALVQGFDLVRWLFPAFEGAPDPLYSVFGNSGLLGGYIAMAVPITIHRAMTKNNAVLSLPMLATYMPALAFSASRAAWLAALIGTLVVFPYRAIPVRRAVGFAFIAIVMAAAAFALFPETRRSLSFADGALDTLRLRIWFWDGAVRMFSAHPIAGVGLGQFQYWSPRYQGDALLSNPNHLSNETHTLYAHNEPLQFAAETGVIGIALCLWMLARLVRCRGPEWGGLAAAFVFGLFHFPLHSAPHALVIILFATMLMARRIETSDAGTSSPLSVARIGVKGRALGAIAALSISGLFATFTVWDVLLPSRALRAANNLHEQGEPANDAYENAIKTGRYHAQAHANYANALLQRGELDRARTQLELALQGQDTGDLHLALGYIALQQGDLDIARSHLLAAIHRWPNNAAAREYLLQAQR